MSVFSEEKTHILVSGLVKRYPGAQAPAIAGVDLAIRRGEIFGIIGRSGAGKSSLLRTFNRLELPTEGSVQVAGQDVGSLTGASLMQLRRRIGMIFQHFNLLSAKTAFGNVALPLKVAGVGRDEIERRVTELLDLVGLADKRDAYPAQLSGGQKQRVGIARALVHRPEILLCDEATSALDPESTDAILTLLRDINSRLGLTIVLITHEMSVIHEICHRVVVLDQGRVVEEGEVWNIFGAPQHDVTRALLRTLQKTIPGDLREGLLDQPQASDDRLVLDLHYTGGQGRGPDLAGLVEALGSGVELLFGGIDRIQGHGQGHLLVAIERRGRSDADILARVQSLSDDVRKLGYVPDRI
ncbi:methionine ABC transporter ATP-binding protein [Pseudochelatococcus contaminans]|uniref:Cell division ATP-binding protein FtsE n=1 Tax=Pseudochelatococcus contaminans TaxID=1538103 RepID=A0A7W5Z1X8_9HYPH|nr:methionine ABC transporter ATP-binding protein [Pseudochelatococcus contaminans]MBB3808583.1 D-methionine transport system ATP-binding protein [Pseudochelatococcus contaminans]